MHSQLVVFICLSVALASCSSSVDAFDEIAEIFLSHTDASLQVGATLQLSAEAQNASGQPVPGLTVTWSSSDQAVASVDSGGLVTATAPGAAMISASVGGQTASAALTVFDLPPGGGLVLDDDFGGYTDRNHLLDTDASDNPWSDMTQHWALVPGEYIFLEEDPPAGATGGKTMRYDHGMVDSCADNVLDTGGGAWFAIPGQFTEVWVEIRLYPENWTSDACGFFAYKLVFLLGPPNARADLNWVSQGLQGSGGPGSNSTVFTGGNSQKTSFADFVDTWTVLRWHVRLSSTPGESADGAFRLWIDGEQVADFDEQVLNLEYFRHLRLGANLNNMALQSMRTHWDYARLWVQDPGW